MLFFALKGSEVLGRRIAAAGGWPIAPHEERDFARGEHKARPLVDPRGRDVFVLAALQGGPAASVNDRVMRLLFFLATCRDHGAARVTAIALYLPYGRKDRRTKDFDPLGARYIAQAIEAMGCDQLVTLEAHNTAALECAFRRPVLHLASDRLWAADIAARLDPPGLPLAVLSPDPGGIKRAQLMGEALETATGRAVRFGLVEKRRSAGVVTGTAVAGDVMGAAVHIVDDMICGGTTLLRAAQAARARGAAQVHGLATHALFTDGLDTALVGNGVFDSLTVTDATAPFAHAAIGLAGRLRVLGTGPMIAAAIARIHKGRPECPPAPPCAVPLETHQ